MINIAGYEAVTLLDYPGVIASVVFLPGCNLRCRFCHNPELVLSNGGGSADDFFEYLRLKRVDGVSITGGEPLVHGGLESFLTRIKNLNLKIKLDTNGFSPDKLAYVASKGLLDYVAVDIKGLNQSDIDYVVRAKVDISDFYRSVELINTLGLMHELRLTVWKEFDESAIAKFCSTLPKSSKIFLQRASARTRLLDKRMAAKLPLIDYDLVFSRFQKYTNVCKRDSQSF